MSSVNAITAIWSNNPLFVSLFTGSEFAHPMTLVNYKESSSSSYVLVIVDLESDLADISQKVISIYDDCRGRGQKLGVVLLHGSAVDSEKNLYFTQLLDQLGGESPLHRLVLVKDLYHENLLDSETWLEKFVIESIVNSKIYVSRKGQNEIYPLSAKDFVVALQKILFLSNTAGKTFWLIGDPLTDLDLGYLIKKGLEDTDSDFAIEATEENRTGLDLNFLGNQSRGLLNWEPVDDFHQKLKSAIQKIGEDKSVLISALHQSAKVAKHPELHQLLALKQKGATLIRHFKIKKNGKKAVETSGNILKKVGEWGFALITLTYLLLTIIFISFTSMSLVSLEKSLTFARSADLQASVDSLEKSNSYIRIGESAYTFTAPVFSFLAPDFHEKNHNLFVFLHYSQSSLQNLQQTYQLAEKIYQSIGSPSETINYDDSALVLKSNLSQVYENINQIQLLTQSGKLPKILEDKLGSSAEFKKISEIENQTAQLLRTVDLMPAMLAGDEAKNIVIVFQNSNEIRSTGGVIDYLLAIVIDKGKVISKNIYTGSDIDGLVIEPVQAPPLVDLFTGSEKWKVRDLNYNPDFPSTASNLSAILSRGLKFKPDIIIAVNESLLSELLKQDQGILLNGQNLTSTIFESELSKVSPNPTYRQLIEHYLDQVVSHKISLLSLGRVLAKQSGENQILFWSSNIVTEKSFVDQTYSGGVFPHSCHPGVAGINPCIAETTFLSESNFSLVPVGSGLQRRIRHIVSFSEIGIKHEYIIDFKFQKEFTGLNRDLNEVFQLFAPQNSIMEPVTLNGKVISATSILHQQDNLLERFQIPISLRFNIDSQLVIGFRSETNRILRLPMAYSLTEYRQPGLVGSTGNVELYLALPESIRATLITSPAVSSPEGYSYIYPGKTATFGLVMEAKTR